MRPFVIELGHEFIEAGLLLKAVCACGPGCLFLQGQMHPLMASILLRMAGLDALDLDAEPQPPDGELRKVEEPVGAGEGDAVVGADCARQATLAKELLKGGNC